MWKILLNIFIYFSSLHVSDIHVSIIRRKMLYLRDTGICNSVGVANGLLVGLSFNTTSDKYQCRIDAEFAPDDGHVDARNM
jgi:hypothetical protein